jgi:hypothetical protein
MAVPHPVYVLEDNLEAARLKAVEALAAEGAISADDLREITRFKQL